MGAIAGNGWGETVAGFAFEAGADRCVEPPVKKALTGAGQFYFAGANCQREITLCTKSAPNVNAAAYAGLCCSALPMPPPTFWSALSIVIAAAPPTALTIVFTKGL